MENKRDNIKGVVGTVLFHAIILIILLLTGFKTPLPLPEEIGVEIQGGSSLGYGDNYERETAALPEQPKNHQSTNNNYATQNIEESYNINKTNTDNKNNNTTQQEEIKPKKWVPDGSIFSQKNGIPGGTENGGFGNSYGGGAGNTPGEGKGTGIGAGTGIGYELEGREAKYLPKPDKNFSESGRIVVTIYVDRNGNVTRATPGARGSTSSSEVLKKLALTAALKSKFHPVSNAPEEQIGTITYDFRLD